jgi:hypothetical protein
MKNGAVWLALFTIERSIVMTIIYKAIGNEGKKPPTKNQSTLTLFNQAPQNVETKIEFPRSEFHRQMANKRKER